MRNLFHITLLLMLSFPTFGLELSTLKTGANVAKGLSPSFYEDVMSNIELVQKHCSSAYAEKEKNLARIEGKIATTAMAYKLARASLINTPKVMEHKLSSIIEKLQGAKADYLKTPWCEAGSLISSSALKYFPNLLDGIFEKATAVEQFNYAINYLKSIRDEISMIANHDEHEELSLTKATSKEQQIYSNCSKKLAAVIKEFGHEK